MKKRPKEYKFTFTFKDIAEVKRIKAGSVSNATKRGYLNPNDLRSITRYIYGDMIRELIQTLKFWKDKAQKGNLYMNPGTGEIRNFGLEKFERAIKDGWVDWCVDELIELKNCCFRVKEVNIEAQTITLKAISKKMMKKKGE